MIRLLFYLNNSYTKIVQGVKSTNSDERGMLCYPYKMFPKRIQKVR